MVFASRRKGVLFGCSLGLDSDSPESTEFGTLCFVDAVVVRVQNHRVSNSILCSAGVG